MITNPASLTHDDLLQLLIQAAELTATAARQQDKITAFSRYEYEPGYALAVMAAIDPDGWYFQILLDEQQIAVVQRKANVTTGAITAHAFGIIEHMRVAILAAGYDDATTATTIPPEGRAWSA